MGESYYAPDQPEVEKLLDFPVQNYVDAIPVKQEYVGELSNSVNAVDPDYLLDEPFFDVTNNQLDNGEYLETGDLSNTILGDPSYLDMVEEYLTFYDAENGNSQYMPFDTLDMIGSENPFSDQSCFTQEVILNFILAEIVPFGCDVNCLNLSLFTLLCQHLNGGAQQESMGSQQLWQGLENDAASSSEQGLEKLGSGKEKNSVLV